MKHTTWLIVIALLAGSISCRKTDYDGFNPVLAKANPHLKIAVVSDIHYLSPNLITNNGAAGQAFQDYLTQDPKLLEYSAPIFKKVLSELTIERPDIVLIPGDLTKDGEKLSHQEMAAFLTSLASKSIQVYVLPGNHDINNAKASRYDGDNAYTVPTIQANEFSTIYGNFGYNNALYRDPNSLSYVAQASKKLWILAIDASKYEEYTAEGDVADGRIKPQTLSWALAKLAEARKKNITVFAMMHHNLVEHYRGQSELDPSYVIEDWPSVANQLADAGLKVIFTGHYHANDITSYQNNGKELFDIETGSLVTPKSPYRIVTWKNKHLEIRTNNVQSISASIPGGMSFPAYSNLFLSNHLDGYFYYFLTAKLGVPAELATFAAPLFRNAVMAHFAGDEKMPPDQKRKIEQLEAMAPPLAVMVNTLWTDLGVKDNDVMLKIE